MSTYIMSETTKHNPTNSKSVEEKMIIKILLDMLLSKYPAQTGEKAAPYMERLLTMREGASPKSKLFVETELLMTFLLLQSLQSEIKKAKESGANTTDLLSGYVHNKQRFNELVDEWIELN